MPCYELALKLVINQGLIGDWASLTFHYLFGARTDVDYFFQCLYSIDLTCQNHSEELVMVR
jgi:hypothetical protein